MDEIKYLIQQHPILFGILLLVLFLIPYLYQKGTTWRLRSWKKSLNLEHHELVFQQLYNDTDGYVLSRQERQLRPDAVEYTYGEIEFLPFIALLSLAKPDKNTVFYDLGSGIGKAVIACAMVYPVQKAVGIELFSTLSASACEQAEKLAGIPDYAEKAKHIEFIEGDFFAVIPKDATLIFINSTTFIGTIWEQLSAYIDTLPHLNTVITTTRPLISTQFSPIIHTRLQMSWGVVLAYIHSRSL